MVDARHVVKAKFEFIRLEDKVILRRDNFVLKIDCKIGTQTIEDGEKQEKIPDAKIKVKKEVFGVFGQISLP